MDAQRINRLSAKAVIIFSVVALATVLTGYFQAPQPDEGAGAHIFQLSIVALAGAALTYLATADWKQPLRTLLQLAPAGIVLMGAFAALFYLEHYFYVAHR